MSICRRWSGARSTFRMRLGVRRCLEIMHGVKFCTWRSLITRWTPLGFQAWFLSTQCRKRTIVAFIITGLSLNVWRLAIFYSIFDADSLQIGITNSQRVIMKISCEYNSAWRWNEYFRTCETCKTLKGVKISRRASERWCNLQGFVKIWNVNVKTSSRVRKHQGKLPVSGASARETLLLLSRILWWLMAHQSAAGLRVFVLAAGMPEAISETFISTTFNSSFKKYNSESFIFG